MGKIQQAIQEARDNAPVPEVSRQSASDVLAWHNHPGTKLFLEWIEEQALKPVTPSANHFDMVTAAARSDCFRKVLQHVKNIKRQAEVALDG